MFALSLRAKNRNDEVKLSGALHKIVEEDPSLSFEARGETHELLLRGQGEMHLKVAVDKLAGRYNVAVETAPGQRHATGRVLDIRPAIRPVRTLGLAIDELTRDRGAMTPAAHAHSAGGPLLACRDLTRRFRSGL